MRITIVCVDCLRYTDIVHGMKMATFLGESWRFTNAYAAGASTIPSVPTFLTGVVPTIHRSTDASRPVDRPTWFQPLRDRGFKAVCYTENYFRNYITLFDEWWELPWLKGDRKATSDDYHAVWERIEREEQDTIFYVHLMDVHPPYRPTPTIAEGELPWPFTTYEFIYQINRMAWTEPSPQVPWRALCDLREAEVRRLDAKLEFPGDIVVLMADHGDTIGESFGGHHFIGHEPSHFSDENLRIPLGIRGYHKEAYCHTPFCTRDLGRVLLDLLDQKPLNVQPDLYWEDFWRGRASYSVRSPRIPKQGLIVSSTPAEWCGSNVFYQSPFGAEFVATSLGEVPSTMVEMLLTRMVAGSEAPPMPDDKEVIERLRALGYIE